LKNIVIVTLCVVIVLSIWIYNNNRKKEVAVFDYSMGYIATKYNEDKNFRNVGIRYDYNRGNYFIILQNDTSHKVYSLEVKLADRHYLVHIEDNTLYDVYPD